MPIVVDSFMFFNEFDVLEGRLEYLYDHVDYFVLVESNITQSGHTKPFHFMNNMTRYHKYLDKMLYFPFVTSRDAFPFDTRPAHERDYDTGPWRLENAQRNHIGEALKLFPEDALIMISDLDEIPHKECIKICQENFSADWQAFAIEQDHFAYNFNQKQKVPIRGTTISTNKYALEQTPQGLRNIKYGFPMIPHGGWHLTYWGTVEDIQYKIETFAHQELNQDEFKDPDHIRQQILAGQDMFKRGYHEYTPVDRHAEIPEDILRIFGPLEKRLLDSLNV